MSVPWTELEQRMAVELRRAGLKTFAIGRQLGRSEKAVRQKLESLGVLRYRRPGELRAEVARRAKRVWYDWELADELGVTPARIQQVRKELGIPSGRTRGKAV